MRISVIIRAAVVVCALAPANGAWAADHRGQVTFSGLPVPGAAVTATRAGASRATVTDDDGRYRFADLADGPWTIEIAMLGFTTTRQEVVVAADAGPGAFVLTVLPFDEIAKGNVVRNDPTPPAPAANTGKTGAAPARPPASGGFQRAAVTATSAASAPAASRPGDAPIVGGGGGGDDRSADAADGFLINGSVNNSASSPFAQLAAFGNNRRGVRSLYNGGIGVVLNNSAWDSSPYSFTNRDAPKPNYSDLQVMGSFAGPVKLGFRSRANLFVGYQHVSNNDATTQTAIVPTLAERRGDFSSTLDPAGRPVRLIDPTTGAPFTGNAIPQSQISPQASALLPFYPLANVDAGGTYNFQSPVLVKTTQDAVQARIIQSINQKNQLFGNVSFQRMATDGANIFNWIDKNVVTGVDAPVNWSHRFNQFMTVRLRYQYTALITHATPFFANQRNVSGEAGITGNDQDPQNWGPPNLTFASGIAGLSSAQYASNTDQTHAGGGEVLWNHGRHNVTYGGDIKTRHLDIVQQQNARGGFTFTGQSTGDDFADFLLGLPKASTIAFGNADKLLHQTLADAYVTDDWRISPSFTANVGVRWEFESPFSEKLGRLVNLDVAPGFTSAAPVVGDNPVHTDFRGIQPRIGVAWRPIAGSSLVVRGGYGIYRNAGVYQTMDLLMAQQPPLSRTQTIDNTSAHPLTMANGFYTPVQSTPLNTFAVDPDFRVGFAHNWQLLVQRDLPASLTMTATYLGTHGSHLLQEFLPNTYPIGAANPCPTCPAGFAYLTSNGTSNRNAAQLQLRRRLRNGLTASVQYTLSKATDNAAAAFTGASVNGAALAQDWLNLDAEVAPSNFDQRHLVVANVQYTSGVGVGGGTLMDGFRGALLKGWTLTAQLTTGSGLPLTPVFLTSVPGTGVTGSMRGDLTGASPLDLAEGYYANPAAYTAPASGRWGNAGRNSIRGPATFSLNGGAGRSFIWTERLSLDWRIDATNLLNRVTFTGVNTIVGSSQFGLPVQANTMRKLTSTLRLRF